MIDVRQPFAFEIEYEVMRPLPSCRVGVIVETADGIVVVTAYDADDPRHAGPRLPGVFTSCCTIPGELLNPGRFVVSLNAGIFQVKNLALLERVLAFEIVDGHGVGAQAGEGRVRRGVIRPRFEWRVQPALDDASPIVAGGGRRAPAAGDRR